jgi:hypothetical protein
MPREPRRSAVVRCALPFGAEARHQVPFFVPDSRALSLLVMRECQYATSIYGVSTRRLTRDKPKC